jgi:cbb3-type cytochrome oxidase maturation protein
MPRVWRGRRTEALMEILYLLIPLSILFVALIGLLLRWAVRSGQYDDLEKPRHDILQDDDDRPPPGDGPR